MKKTGSRLNTSRSINQNDLSKSSRGSDLSNTKREKNQKMSQDDDESKIKPLKYEIKQADFLHTLLIQWAFSNSCLRESVDSIESEVEGQINDRCKQLIELKKQTNSLKAEYNARNKNTILDDVLSMEYSSLKSIEEDILLTNNYIKELEENSHCLLNRLDLDQREIISPQILAETLEKSAFTLKKVSSLIEDESNEISILAEEMQGLVSSNCECSKVFSEISELELKILSLLEQEKISKAEKSFAHREKLIKSYLLDDLMEI